MIAIKQCPGCRGARRILGMGMFSQDCNVCKGIGHIQDKKEEIKELINVAGEPTLIEPIKKKKGRPFGTSKK